MGNICCVVSLCQFLLLQYTSLPLYMGNLFLVWPEEISCNVHFSLGKAVIKGPLEDFLKGRDMR